MIDHRTLAVEAVFAGEYRSKIHTTHGTYYSKLYPRKLLDKACIRYGSTKQGRIQAARILLNYLQKPPFMIAPYTIGAFPTMGTGNPECVWIFNHRFNIDELLIGKSRITFMNGTTILVNASKHTLTKQQQRLHTLISVTGSIHRELQMNIHTKQITYDTYHTPKPF